MKQPTAESRMAFLHKLLEELRAQTDYPEARSQIGVTESRYHRVLNGVEKVLIDHREELSKFEGPYPEICLWAMDILGLDTDEDGWAAQRERAERMGW